MTHAGTRRQQRWPVIVSSHAEQYALLLSTEDFCLTTTCLCRSWSSDQTRQSASLILMLR
jgi:hypothetical protein